MANASSRRRLASRAGGLLFGVLLIAGIVWFVHTMMALKVSKPQRVVQTIQIIKPPPPPPEQPEQAPDRALGVDAEGSAGSDAFGLAARAGGADLIGGTGTAPFAWYTNRMRDAVKERLSAATCTKAAKGSLSTRWILASDGRVKQIKLTTTTGNAKVDECVEHVLDSIKELGEAPPPGMPEQVGLKVVF